MLCLYHDVPALLRVLFQTNHGRENSASYLKIQAGKTSSYLGHALVTLYNAKIQIVNFSIKQLGFLQQKSELFN